ncbi:MAG: LytR/AlgR family response regulator transcription factor [bacterium]
MFQKLVLRLKEPYPPNIDLKPMIPYIAAMGFLVSFFLIIFQPFGLDQYQSPSKNLQFIGLGLMIMAWLAANVAAMPRLLPRLFSEDFWSLGKELVWNTWLCLTTIFVSTFYWSLVTGQRLSPTVFYRVTLNSLLFTVFFTPVGVMCVMSNHIRALKRKLKKAEELTHGLKNSNLNSLSDPLELVSETGKEKVSLRIDKLLYIQSCDNYASVVFRENGHSQEMLIRSSLKNLEQQISSPYILRCHRSFIVNLIQTRSITGNSRNYTLALKNCDLAIPVSRESEKQVLQVLQDLTE